MYMKLRHIYMTVIIIGVLILAAGFIPLTRTVPVTEEKMTQVTEYKEEVKTKEEVYTEEVVTGSEQKEEVLWRKSVPVLAGSTMGETFALTAGDIITLKATSDSDIMLSFTGQGDIYMTLEIGKTIEKEFTIKNDGDHTLLYSPASVTEDAVIDFDIVRVYDAPVVEEVEKTRTVEYTENVPYTTEVPIVEKTTREEQYTVDFLRYIGISVAAFGVFSYLQETRKKPVSKRKKKKDKKLKKKKRR